MRDVPAELTAAWFSGNFIGNRRPMARVTVQVPAMRLRLTPQNRFTDIIFGSTHRPKELPNVRSVEWDRDVDQDIAEATFTFYNIAPLPIGQLPTNGDLDQPGFYTYSRGKTQYSARWGHVPNEWAGMLMPDNILRSYEGYGFTPGVCPEDDPLLVQTGVWRIDEVQYTHDGIIQVRARDIGSVLADQIAYPPVVPFRAGFVNKDIPDGAYSYPVSFTAVPSEPTINNVPIAPTKLSVRFNDSSNTPYLIDRYNSDRNGAIYGHRGRDAFDGDTGTYWLSIGNNRPDRSYAFEWIQGSISRNRVRRVRFRTKGTGYTCWLGVFANGQWQGTHVVPYDPNNPVSFPNGANQKYVASQVVRNEGWHEFTVDIPDATVVRLTFSSLWDSNLGEFQYRAAVREFEVYGGALTRQETITYADNNYNDYCADESTEVLSERGWLRHDEVVVGDRILTLNPATMRAEWQPVKSVYRKHYDRRPMVSLESASHSSLTTPDHRWLVRLSSGAPAWRTTETLRTGHSIPLAASGAAAEVPTYSDELVELAAWYWTEGTLLAGGGVELSQSEHVNPEMVDRIRKVLGALFGPPGPVRRSARVGPEAVEEARRLRADGATPTAAAREVGVSPQTVVSWEKRGWPTWALWNEYARNNGVVVFRVAASACRRLTELVRGSEKVPTPDFLLALTQDQLDRYIDISIAADGWSTHTTGLSQASLRRTEAFEMACALAGRAYVRTGDGPWVVTLKRHDRAHVAAMTAEVTEYRGTIWCPTVQNSTWFARRGGKTYFTGNTDIVKLFLAWGGFYWPKTSRIRKCDGTYRDFNHTRDDPALTIKYGQVWGDFKLSGTYGPATLTADLFDKKPLIEAISYIRDILGYLFYIDEEGAAVFRPPNIYSVGNTTLVRGDRAGGRTARMVSIDERQTLMSLRATLSNRNIRERVFVSTADGSLGAIVPGWNPNPTGLRRVAGWSDQHFSTEEECRVMAELIALRQLFTYRTDSLTIPAYPAIQVDDQVRIFERTTSEGFVHYVKSISSRNDLETGEWTYDLGTHWLGEAPFRRWVYDPAQLSRETQQYLRFVHGVQ